MNPVKGYAYVIDVIPDVWRDAEPAVIDLARKNIERALEEQGLLPLFDTFSYEVQSTKLNTDAGLYEMPGDHTDSPDAYEARVVFKMKGHEAITYEFVSVEK